MLFAQAPLESVGGAPRNSCLACGGACGLSTPPPTFTLASATLGELNGLLHGCHLVHCWDATEAALGIYAALRYSGAVAPPPAPAHPPLPPSSPEALFADYEVLRSYALVYAIVLGSALFVMCSGCALYRRDVPLAHRPKALLEAASQRATAFKQATLVQATVVGVIESPSARLNRPGSQAPPVVYAESV